MNNANQDLCFLSLPALQRSFRVLQMEGWEEVSRGFAFTVEALTDDSEITYQDVMFMDAKLDLLLNDSARTIHGIITECQVRPAENNQNAVTFVLRPVLHKLTYSIQCRVFQKQSLGDVIKFILDANKYPLNQVNFKAARLDAVVEFIVQYNESDFAFISRIMEQVGVSYYFEDDGTQSILTIAEKNETAPALKKYPELRFLPRAGLTEEAQDAVYDLTRSLCGTSSSFSRKAYGYLDPGSNVSAQQSLSQGFGDDSRYTSEVSDVSGVSEMASISAEISRVMSEHVQGSSSCHLLQAGMRIKINGFGSASFTGEYFLVRLSHKVSQVASVTNVGKNSSYLVTFQAVPGAVPFRPQRLTPRPRVSGVLPAHTGGENDKYAFVDEAGRYRVKLPFDTRDSADGCLSLPIRLSQPYSGPDYGMHFPLHKNTELLVAFEDGDINRPIAVGTVPNPSNNTPATSSNASQNLLKSAAGHRFLLDDNEDSPIVELVSASGHVVRLNDTKDQESILIMTKAGHQLLLDDKNQQIVINDQEHGTTLLMNTKDKQISMTTAKGHTVILDDKNDKIAFQTGKGQKAALDDAGKAITFQDADGKHIIKIDGSGNKISLSSQGDIEVGAKGALVLSGKSVSIKSDSADVNIKSAGKLNGEGMNVNLKSTQKLTMEAGMDASLKGGMNLKLEGTINTNVKAGVALKATGTMANLEATGIATIKGAMVMVN